MVGMELRSHPGLRRSLRVRLWTYCATSDVCLCGYSAFLGERCSAANLFLGPKVVSSDARFGLPGRVRLALDTSGRAGRCRRNSADKSISPGCARTDWLT